MLCEAVVLAAGHGTRMNSSLSKVLHPLLGRPMVQWVVEACREATGRPVTVVVGPEAHDVRAAVKGDVRFVVQEERLGTGHAALQTKDQLEDAAQVLVVSADMPLLRAETLQRLIETQSENQGPLTVLTAQAETPRGFGRLLRDDDGQVARVVEAAHASPEELAVRELNVGAYCIEADWLWTQLPELELSPKGEYYITDLVEEKRQAAAQSIGRGCRPPRGGRAGEVDGLGRRPLQWASVDRVGRRGSSVRVAGRALGSDEVAASTCRSTPTRAGPYNPSTQQTVTAWVRRAEFPGRRPVNSARRGRRKPGCWIARPETGQLSNPTGMANAVLSWRVRRTGRRPRSRVRVAGTPASTGSPPERIRLSRQPDRHWSRSNRLRAPNPTGRPQPSPLTHHPGARPASPPHPDRPARQSPPTDRPARPVQAHLPCPHIRPTPPPQPSPTPQPGRPAPPPCFLPPPRPPPPTGLPRASLR